jgi:predicted nucleic acid-binding Zn ribbon protein
MGFDAFIYNPESRLIISLRCYVCGFPIDNDRPLTGHEQCSEFGLDDQERLRAYFDVSSSILCR